MWIALNKKKAHRFTTKGINLNSKNPATFVDTSIMEGEYLQRIQLAIDDGTLRVLTEDEGKNISVDNEAKMSQVEELEDELIVKKQIVLDKETGEKMYFLTMPDKSSNYKDIELNESQIILTDSE